MCHSRKFRSLHVNLFFFYWSIFIRCPSMFQLLMRSENIVLALAINVVESCFMTLRCKSSFLLGLLKPLLFLQQMTKCLNCYWCCRDTACQSDLVFCIVHVHTRCCLELVSNGYFWVNVITEKQDHSQYNSITQGFLLLLGVPSHPWKPILLWQK